MSSLLFFSTLLIVLAAWLIYSLNHVQIKDPNRHRNEPESKEIQSRTYSRVGCLAWHLLLIGIFLFLIAVTRHDGIGLKNVLIAVGVAIVLMAFWIVGKLLIQSIYRRRSNAILARAFQGEIEQALEDALNWNKQNPEEKQSWVTLATLHSHKEDWSIAEEIIRQFEGHHPKETDLRKLKACVVAKQGRLDESVELFHAALEQGSADVPFLLSFCQVLLSVGSGEEAAEQYCNAVKQHRRQFIFDKKYRQWIAHEIAECRSQVSTWLQNKKDI
ncbi:MAG: hypothetical protein K8T91_10500 [Planctomycetes bacterium]|nr:hypothetical protein [Planctomycetota bacterium]